MDRVTLMLDQVGAGRVTKAVSQGAIRSDHQGMRYGDLWNNTL